MLPCRVEARLMSCLFGARVSRILPVLTLVVAIAIGLASSERVAAAPVLHAELTQTCAGCGLAGPPFPTLGGKFVSAVPAHLDQNLFQLNHWPIRQQVVVFPPTGSAETHYVQGGTVGVQGRAIAVPGGIGLLAQNAITAQTFEENASSFGTVASHAQARFRVDNNMVTGSAPAGTRVPALLNLPVRGFIGVNASGAGGFGGTYAQADLLVDVILPGARHVGTLQLRITNQSSGRDVTVNGSGFLEGLEAEVEIDNPLFPLGAQIPISLDLALPFSPPVNSPFVIDVFGRAQTVGSFNLSAAEGGWLHHMGGLIDFVDTVSFPNGSPVLDLPVGFTFNSVDGRVVDNMWLGSVAAVPEPTTWLLMSLGLATAVLRCKQRRPDRHSEC